MSEAELKLHPHLLQVAKTAKAATPSAAVTDPLFNGTLFFVQVAFNLTGCTISISNADMALAVEYAANACVPISAYASQYGSSALSVSPNVLQFSANVPSGRYNDQTLQGWVNTILTQSGLPAASSCIVILNPRGVTNTDGDITLGILGYHGKANSSYCFVNVFGEGLTLNDLADVYALQLSHETAEMAVDPNVDHKNPEVCDPCGPNCQSTWRDFFVTPNNIYSQSTQTFPPGFAFTFFIKGIFRSNSATECPALQDACAYSPPTPVFTITVRRSTGKGFGPGPQANEDWSHGPCFGSRGTLFADADGDGKADAIWLTNG